MKTVKTKSQRRDYMQKKAAMLKQMCDIGDSVFSYVAKYKDTNMEQLILDIYYGRPYHTPLNQCCYEGTKEIDWDKAEMNLSIMRNKLATIRELCK